MTGRLTRRGVLGSMSGAGALLSPFAVRPAAAASAPILIGVPTAQTSMAGVADHQDYLNGTTLAIEEVNAAGGVLGRPLKAVVVDNDPISPESGQIAINKLIDARVQAISCAFSLTPVPAAEASATSRRRSCGVRRSATSPSSWPGTRPSTATCSRPTRQRCTTAGRCRCSCRP